MSPEELNFIHKHLAAYGVTALVAVALVYLVCRYALGEPPRLSWRPVGVSQAVMA
jgi:hypothetical protein